MDQEDLQRLAGWIRDELASVWPDVVEVEGRTDPATDDFRVKVTTLDGLRWLRVLERVSRFHTLEQVTQFLRTEAWVPQLQAGGDLVLAVEENTLVLNSLPLGG